MENQLRGLLACDGVSEVGSGGNEGWGAARQITQTLQALALYFNSIWWEGTHMSRERKGGILEARKRGRAVVWELLCPSSPSTHLPLGQSDQTMCRHSLGTHGILWSDPSTLECPDGKFGWTQGEVLFSPETTEYTSLLLVSNVGGGSVKGGGVVSLITQLY